MGKEKPKKKSNMTAQTLVSAMAELCRICPAVQGLAKLKEILAKEHLRWFIHGGFC